MRLSEQGLSTAEDVVRAGGRLTKDGILALIAEVRALRECEKAAAVVVLSGADGIEIGYQVCAVATPAMLDLSRALAAVRALEDKP